MSIKAYSSILENISSSNYFDIYDQNLNKIRFTLRDQQLYITSYNPTTNTWFPATVIFENAPLQSTSMIDYQDILSANNIRVQLNSNVPANGKEVLILENDNNYNTIKGSGLNYAIDSSPYKPTVNLDDRAVIYQIDTNGKPRLTLSNISLNNLSQNFVTLTDDQTITGVKTFNTNKFLLGGNGGNVTINGSQVANSSSYILEYPTAAPSSALNILTTSGASPYSKLIWTDLSTYVLASTFDQLSALNTTGSPSFSNLTISAGGVLNLNYMAAPASSDVLVTLNTNKQLTNSGVSLSGLATLGTSQTFSADKIFNYSAGKIKLSNYSTDNTGSNNILMLNSSGYIVPCNKLYSDIVDIASTQTISGNKTLSGATTISSSLTLSGVNSDTATSSGQKLAVLNTTSNGVERINITPDTLITTSSGTQTIAGNKTFSGVNSFSSSGNTFKTNLGIIGSTSGTLTLTPAATTTSYELTFPATVSGVTKGALISNTSGIMSWEDFSNYMLLSGAQTNSAANTWSGVNTFNSDKLVLAGNGGNLTLNASQAASSSAYTLEYPTAAPSGAMNVLTTSGSTPFSKYTWTDLSTYLTSATAASTYVALTGNQTIAGNKTLSGATTMSSTVTLSGVNADTATSSGQKLAVLNTTSNNVERVNITPNTLVTTSSGTQTIAGVKTFSDIPVFSNGAKNLVDWCKNHMYMLGGYVTWKYVADTNTNFLYWGGSIILPSNGSTRVDITCPTSGNITLYNNTTTASTIACTNDGINFNYLNGFVFLYYVIDPTNLSAPFSQSNFRLVSYNTQVQRDLINNNTIDPNTWIYIASQNNLNTLTFKPMNITLATGETRYENGNGNVVTGNVTFNSITTANIENLFCSSIQAQYTLTCSGTVTWTGSRLKWDARTIAIPVERPEMGGDGGISIDCPASGVAITTYDQNNTGGANGTTVNTDANGISITPWSALWYRLSRGITNNTINSNYAVTHFQNTFWRPSSNWILLAIVNSDNTNRLTWFPNKVTIPPNHIYNNISGFVGAQSTVQLDGLGSMTIFSGITANIWYEVYVFPTGTNAQWASALGRFTCIWAASTNENRAYVNSMSPSIVNFQPVTITMDANNIYLTNPVATVLRGTVLVKRLH